MQPVLIDFESRSRADLKRVGGRNYWAHASTEVLCCAWHDTATGVYGMWRPGAPPLGGRVFAAHSAQGFDRFGAERLGFAPAGWVDTSQLARVAGLPGALEALAERMGAPAKDKVASRFTVALSTCRRPPSIKASAWAELEDHEKKALGVQATYDAAARERVEAYCALDVQILAEAWPQLQWWDQFDQDARRVDQAVNDRGICFDRDLARALLASDAHNSELTIASVAAELGWTTVKTALAARSPKQFCEATGLPNAQKATLEGCTHPLARARDALASIARGKLEAGLALVGADGRLRDTHRYYGAHTGRWSGKGMQLQNMPRPAKEFESLGVAEICAGADACIGGHLATQAEIDVLLRGCIVASPGNTLAVCDFTGVEARALAWVANDTRALEAFKAYDNKTGANPYSLMGAHVFGIPVEQASKGTYQYTIGKTLELACLGPGTKVLTKRGYVPITSLDLADQLWDGITWVNHKGLVVRGKRQTVTLHGLELTPDHRILCGLHWYEARDLINEPSLLRRALATCAETLQSLGLAKDHAAVQILCGCSAIVADRRIVLTSTTGGQARLRVAMLARKFKQGARKKAIWALRQLSRTWVTGDGCSIVSQPYTSAVRAQKRACIPTTAAVGLKCTQPGGRIKQLFCAISRRCADGISLSSTWIASTMKKAMSRVTCGLLPGKLTARTSVKSRKCSSALTALRPVYDIAHAGPNNRFTVWTDHGPIIVHNCGYGQGASKFIDTAWKMGRVRLDPATSKEAVRAWRQLHASIVQLWTDIEKAFRDACFGVPSKVGCFEFNPFGRGIAVTLPSGRPIMYNDVRIAADGSLEFAGTKCQEYTYGGKLVENLIQAMCRCLMADALVRAEAAGLCPVMHVHDEIVCDVPASAGKEAYDYLRTLMCTLPDWAKGFPVGASGFYGLRYHK